MLSSRGVPRLGLSSPSCSEEGSPAGEGRRAGGVRCFHFAASESTFARGKVKLFLQVCSTNAGDHEAKAGVGDEAEQDTNDKGKCQSKLLSGSSWPMNTWFASVLLHVLNFNSV